MKTLTTELRSATLFGTDTFNDTYCTHLERLNEAMCQTGMSDYSTVWSSLLKSGDKFVLSFSTNIR